MLSSNWVAFSVQAFLEIQYNFYRTSIFQKNWEHDAVLLYRMKHAEEFHDHVAVIPYRFDLNFRNYPVYSKHMGGSFQPELGLHS